MTLGCFFREFHNGRLAVGKEAGPHVDEATWARLKYSFCWVLVEDTRICYLRRWGPHGVLVGEVQLLLGAGRGHSHLLPSQVGPTWGAGG
jgi:hypothetical protein